MGCGDHSHSQGFSRTLSLWVCMLARHSHIVITRAIIYIQQSSEADAPIASKPPVRILNTHTM